MEMPLRLDINGVAYVREDSIPERPEGPLERLFTVPEIEAMTGLNYQTIYRAVKAGRLDARYPNGSSRGMRIPESFYRSWIDSTRG